MEKHNKKVSALNVLQNSFGYVAEKPDEFAMFVLINFGFLLFFTLFVQSLSGPLFLPWILVYYIFWFGFFRYYYKRQPYIFTGKIFGTLGPSAKIMLMMLILLLVLMLGPFVPLLFHYNEEYALFLDRYVSDIKNVDSGRITSSNYRMILVFYVSLMLLSPFIIVRPMFAWISSLIGRSGSLGNAYANSRGNYFPFLLIMLAFEIPAVLLEVLFSILEWNITIEQLLLSPLIVLGNISIAKTYDICFLSPEKD